jgi:hypothetical protein
MKEDQNLLRECNAELALHFKNAELEAEIEKLKGKVNCIYKYCRESQWLSAFDIKRCMDDDPTNDYAQLIIGQRGGFAGFVPAPPSDSTQESRSPRRSYLVEVTSSTFSSRSLQCRRQQEALKRNLWSCNSDLKSKINEQSAELGEPVRNGRVLLGSSDGCASVMKEEQDLLAECKAELAVHSKNAALKAELKKQKRNVSCANKWTKHVKHFTNSAQVVKFIRERWYC